MAVGVKRRGRRAGLLGFVCLNGVTDREWAGALVGGHLVSDSSQRVVATWGTRIVEEKQHSQ